MISIATTLKRHYTNRTPDMDRIKNLAKPKYTTASTALDSVRKRIDNDDFKNNKVPEKVSFTV
jgi:hypothetical protein